MGTVEFIQTVIYSCLFLFISLYLVIYIFYYLLSYYLIIYYIYRIIYYIYRIIIIITRFITIFIIVNLYYMDQTEEAEEKVFTGEWYADSAIMLEILNQITFYCGSDRKRMLYTKPGAGSMLYGTTWRGHLSYTPDGKQVLRDKCPDTGLFKTKIYSEYPELKGILKEYSNLHFPDFEWNQCQLNKDFPCPPHLDSDNVGESVLVAFGHYLDGQTCIWRDNKIEKHDARDKPLRFNGSKLLHWVKPIRSEGTRYSIVFFNNAYGLKKNNK